MEPQAADGPGDLEEAAQAVTDAFGVVPVGGWTEACEGGLVTLPDPSADDCDSLCAGLSSVQFAAYTQTYDIPAPTADDPDATTEGRESTHLCTAGCAELIAYHHKGQQS